METPEPSEQEIYDLLLEYYGGPELVESSDETKVTKFRLAPRGFVITLGGVEYLLAPVQAAILYDIAMAFGKAILNARINGPTERSQDPAKVNEAVSKIKEAITLRDLEKQLKQE